MHQNPTRKLLVFIRTKLCDAKNHWARFGCMSFLTRMIFFLCIFLSNGNTLQFLILYLSEKARKPKGCVPPYFLQSSVFFEELFEDYFEELQTMFFEVEMIINNAHLT